MLPTPNAATTTPNPSPHTYTVLLPPIHTAPWACWGVVFAAEQAPCGATGLLRHEADGPFVLADPAWWAPPFCFAPPFLSPPPARPSPPGLPSHLWMPSRCQPAVLVATQSQPHWARKWMRPTMRALVRPQALQSESAPHQGCPHLHLSHLLPTSASENRLTPPGTTCWVLACKALPMEFRSLPAVAPSWPGPRSRVTEASASTGRQADRAQGGSRAVQGVGETGLAAHSSFQSRPPALVLTPPPQHSNIIAHVGTGHRQTPEG